MTVSATLAGVFLKGIASARPAANAVAGGTVYSATDTGVISQSDGSSWSTWATIAAGMTNPMTTRGDIITGGVAGASQRLALGTAGYGLVSDGTDAVWAEVLPWRVQIVPQISTPDATTGTFALNPAVDSGLLFPFHQPGSVANSGSAVELINSTHAQNDAASWNVVLAKGTWDCNIWVRKSPAAAIITLLQDGVSMGTVDAYAAANAAAKISITGWTVSSSGKKVMQFKAATKNASSSDYYMLLHGIEFRRTA